MQPSILSHIMSGAFLFAGMVLLAMRFSSMSSVSPYRMLLIILLISVAIGVHGISHLGLEKAYGYNPLTLFP
jgi:hypothetical protein